MAGKTIDIEEIFRKRFNGKAPRLLVKIIKRLLHQDFLNGYLKEGYEGVEFCENARECGEISRCEDCGRGA